MRIDIITLFPEMFEPVLNGSIIGRAQKSGVLEIVCHQLRDYAFDKHKRVDDTTHKISTIRWTICPTAAEWECL